MSPNAARQSVSVLLKGVLKELPGHWVQGDWHTVDGRRCLGGWLMFASNTTGNLNWVMDYHLALNYVAKAAKADLGIDDFHTQGWNDAAGRTEREVIELVTKALQLAERDEAAVAA